MFKIIKTRLTEFFQSKAGKTTFKWGRRLFFLGIMAYLFDQLTSIGLTKVFNSLPTNPWFYIILVVMYMALPISELFIYRISVQFDLRKSFPVFMKKKILNSNVVGYSGEAYLFFWLSKNSKESQTDLFKIIKDNNVISSITSTLLSIILLGVFVYFGQINLEKFINLENRLYVWIGIFVFILLVAALIVFRKFVISLPAKTAWLISGIYFFRIIFIYTLQLIQWKVVLPEVPIYVWFTYLALLIIATRIPFLPDRDLIFISASLEISKMLGVAEAAVAGLLIAHNTVNRLLNLVLFAFSSYDKRAKRFSRKKEAFEKKLQETEDISLPGN